MSIKRRILNVAARIRLGERMVNEPRYRAVTLATAALMIDIVYALYHGVLGIIGASWWFISMFAYYAILGTTRFYAVLCERRTGTSLAVDTEYFVLKVSGALLAALSFVLSGVIYMDMSENMASKYGEITMIAIAAYTFTKIILAIIRAARHRNDTSPLLSAIRCIGYAEVAASVFTLQRSMLVSFGDMPEKTADIMNTLTGLSVCIFIFTLGLAMMTKRMRGKRKMAKSKFVQANEKIAEKVVNVYEKIEDGVTGSYKKVENTVVGGYKKVEDAFVERYLTKDGETVEAAKERLKNSGNTQDK